MEFDDKIIIVPWDFTKVAEYALQHAVNYAEIVKGKIIILHIVKKEEEIPAAKEKVDAIAHKNTKESKISTDSLIKAGSIFSMITKVAEELDANMIFMGTHGIQGMQKYLGSWALKVVANTQVPFMVTQAPPLKKTFETILYPINYRKENKESLNWLMQYHKFYNFKIKIFAARYKDRKLKKGVSSNVLFAQKILGKKNIPYEINWAEQRGDFPKFVLNYAKQKKPDLILVMTTRDISFADFLIGANEQLLIANSEKIPVICLSPRPLKNVGGFMAGGG